MYAIVYVIHPASLGEEVSKTNILKIGEDGRLSLSY